jgi:[ribosomal protein S18]-alanine N-acetyltransferase
MSPSDMAALHARAIAVPPPWSAAAFAATLADPACFVLCQPGALLIGRAAAGEAEVLTLATDPALRRRGLAHRLLAGFEAEAARRGAAQAFLEVAEDNGPARSLYDRAGWVQVGRRPAYYPAPAGRVAALVLRKALAA